MGQSLTRRRFLAFSGAALAMSAGMRTGHVAAHESESGWQAAASLLTPREDHTATLLDDRRVLVVGGFEKRDDIRGKAPYVALSDVEWYDPLSDRWQAARNTLDRRGNHTATLLQDGRVLVVGGARERDNTLEAYDTAELYDPLRDRWSQASPLAAPRAFHTATLLDDGRVLVVGGGALGEPPLAGTEIYDSATNRWTAAGRLAVPRVAHTATLQPSGRVLVVGGTARGGSAIPDAEVYIPAENRWVTIAPMRGRRFGHTATLLADRRTLVVGGTEEGSVGNTLRTAEVLRTGSAGWAAAASLSGGRTNHIALAMRDGSVLIVGGREDYLTYPRLTERFDPTVNRFLPDAALQQGRARHTATLLDDGSVLAVGGRDTDVTILGSVERYRRL